MMKYGLFLAVIILIFIGFFYLNPGNETVYTTDTTIEQALDLKSSDTIVLSGNAKLYVKGDATIAGTIMCKGGSLSLFVDGTLTMTGDMRCGGDIAIVARGPIAFGDSAKVTSSGHVQLVRDDASVLSGDALDALYDETGQDSGVGTRIGPMIEGAKVGLPAASAAQAGGEVSQTGDKEHAALPPYVKLFGNVAEAQRANDKEGNAIPGVVVAGRWTIGEGGAPPSGVDVQTPDKKIKKIVLNFNFGPDGNVSLRNFHLVGPAGRAGESDEGKSCNALGRDGENAFRFRVVAQDITLDEFRLELGNGGDGGVAETLVTCDPGIARGGTGGEAGNFKMTAVGQIQINSFHIVPGRGGSGGSSTAHGKDGDAACPGKKGGDATATGGSGGKNKKELAAGGAVAGIGNVTIDPVVGGFGGDANANPGKGGSGSACKCAGGLGGKGTATAGMGGDASLSGIAGVSQGGDGGTASSHGGTGGVGGMCAVDQAQGGVGGNGGSATSAVGKGGLAQTNGTDGEIKDETGGDGGNGGDGCGPGDGGEGGAGKPPGNKGNPGKRICTEPGSQTSIDGGTGVVPGGGGTNVGTDGTSGGATKGGAKTIQAINYKGKYLPREQLIIENEVGCGADHWHAANGAAIATDGSSVPDPGPQCGYGKVSDVPVVQIEVR